MEFVWRKNLLLGGGRVGERAEKESWGKKPQNQDLERRLRLLRQGAWDKELGQPGWVGRALRTWA